MIQDMAQQEPTAASNTIAASSQQTAFEQQQHDSTSSAPGNACSIQRDRDAMRSLLWPLDEGTHLPHPFVDQCIAAIIPAPLDVDDQVQHSPRVRATLAALRLVDRATRRFTDAHNQQLHAQARHAVPLAAALAQRGRFAGLRDLVLCVEGVEDVEATSIVLHHLTQLTSLHLYNQQAFPANQAQLDIAAACLAVKLPSFCSLQQLVLDFDFEPPTLLLASAAVIAATAQLPGLKLLDLGSCLAHPPGSQALRLALAQGGVWQQLEVCSWWLQV